MKKLDEENGGRSAAVVSKGLFVGKQYEVAPDDYCLTSTSLGPQLERFTISYIPEREQN